MMDGFDEATKSPFEKWKEGIKKEWDYGRKQVIFEDGEGNLIIPTTTTTTPTTTPSPVPPVTPKNASLYTSPVVTIDITSVTPNAEEVAQADTGDLIKIIGITCGALVSILIISLVCIRLCRVSAKKKKERVSVKRPLNLEPEEHIYAEIEPLQGAESDGPSGATASGSSGVPLPSKKDKRRLRGVSSFRALSVRIQKWFSTEHAASDDNHSVFYNRSADGSLVQHAPEPPRRNTENGRTKRGKGTGVKRYESQSRRPLLDGDSQISTTSSTTDPRDNVYNPLLREESGRASGPYDFLRLSKTQSGTVKDPDQVVPPQSPHDYFTLEKETKDNGDEVHPLENIVEVDAEDAKSNDNVVVDIENSGMDDFEDVSETPKNHEYFILEPTHATIESPSNKSSVKSKSSVKDNSANLKTGDEADKAIKTEADGKGSPVKSPGSGKTRPVPKPRGLGSPTVEDKDTLPNSSESLKKKTEFETLSKGTEETPNNAYTSLGDTLGALRNNESVNGKDEVYVITKLGDAPRPPVLEADSEDREDYLEPASLKVKPDYVEVCPAPPPRTSSRSPSVSPAPSRTNSKEYASNSKEEYPLVSDIRQIESHKEFVNKLPARAPTVPKHSPHVSPTHSGVSPKHSPSVSPKPTKSPTKDRPRTSPKRTGMTAKEQTKVSPSKHSVAIPKQTSVETDV